MGLGLALGCCPPFLEAWWRGCAGRRVARAAQVDRALRRARRRWPAPAWHAGPIDRRPTPPPLAAPAPRPDPAPAPVVLDDHDFGVDEAAKCLGLAHLDLGDLGDLGDLAEAAARSDTGEAELGRSVRRVLTECAGHCLIRATAKPALAPPKPKRQYAHPSAE